MLNSYAPAAWPSEAKAPAARAVGSRPLDRFYGCCAHLDNTDEQLFSTEKLRSESSWWFHVS
jgi:hypothetical protein